MKRFAAHARHTTCIAIVVALGCAESAPRVAPSPAATGLHIAARSLAPASPWAQAPVESGMVLLPPGTTPCDVELWDHFNDHTRVMITSCNGEIHFVDQAPGDLDASNGLCTLTPLLKPVGPSPCSWQGAGVWRSHAGGIAGIWPIRFRLGADCFSMHYPPLYGCMPMQPLPYHAIGTVVPRAGLTAPKIHAIRNFGASGHQLVLLDADPTLAPHQVRIVRSDIHFQYATASVHALLDGPTSAADVPHGVSGRGDGMLAIAGPTGVWYGAADSPTFARVFVPAAQGPTLVEPTPGCCDIAWQPNLVGPGTFVLAPRQGPELVLLDDASGDVVATWVPTATKVGYAPFAIRALSANQVDATVIFAVEEQAIGAPPRHVVHWLGWPLLGSRRGPTIPIAMPGLGADPSPGSKSASGSSGK